MIYDSIRIAFGKLYAACRRDEPARHEAVRDVGISRIKSIIAAIGADAVRFRWLCLRYASIEARRFCIMIFYKGGALLHEVAHCHDGRSTFWRSAELGVSAVSDNKHAPADDMEARRQQQGHFGHPGARRRRAIDRP